MGLLVPLKNISTTLVPLMLCISTSKWVLCMLFAVQNNIFYNIVVTLQPVIGRKVTEVVEPQG